jgi:Asp/Glu/hydantoin racemase
VILAAKPGADFLQLLLVNPNTNVATTERMVEIAREAAPPGVVIEGATAGFGAPLITEPGALAIAADAVEALVQSADTRRFDGVIVAAFGDPGLDRIRAIVPFPVTGIAEAGMAEAAAGGRRFAVATTTPDLVASIEGLASRYGHAAFFIGTYLTTGHLEALMREPERLADALEDASREAIAAGAEAVVIGGGPLAVAARTIAPRIPVPIVEPIPAAVGLAIARRRRTETTAV